MNRREIIDETSNDPDLLSAWRSPSTSDHNIRVTTNDFDLNEPALTDVLDWDWWDGGSEPRWVPLNEYIKRRRAK